MTGLKFSLVDDISSLPSLEGRELIPIDLETYAPPGGHALDPYTNKVALVSLKIDGHAYLIRANKVDWADLKTYLLKGKSFIAHNMVFDYKVLKRHGIVLPNPRCTMALVSTVAMATGWKFWKENKKLSLKQVAASYCGVLMPKEEAVSDWGSNTLTKKQQRYAAGDVWYLNEIWDKVYSIVKDLGCEHSSWLNQGMVPVVGDMELEGVVLDLNRVEILSEAVQKERDKTALKLCQALKFPIYCKVVMKGGKRGKYYVPKAESIKALNSPQRLLPAINKYTSLSIISTDKETLTKNSDNEVIANLINYRKYEKLLADTSKYAKAINPVSGKVHTGFKCPGTFTGRLTSSGYKLKDAPDFMASINFQQASGVPFKVSAQKLYPNMDIKEASTAKNNVIKFRNCFRAEEGRLLVDADYSGQECAILAAMGDVKTIQEALTQPEYLEGPEGLYKNHLADIHSRIALRMFDFLQELPDHLIVKEAKKPRQLFGKMVAPRYLGKTAFFSLVYGSSAKGIAEKNNISVAAAEEIIEGVYNTYPDMKSFMDLKKALGCLQNWLSNAYGMRMFLNEVNSKGAEGKSALERRGFNSIIQGSGACMTKHAMILIKERVKEVKPVVSVHDGLVYSVPGEIIKTEYVPDKDNPGAYIPKYTFSQEAIDYKDKIVECMEEAERLMLSTATRQYGYEFDYAKVGTSLDPYWAH